MEYVRIKSRSFCSRGRGRKRVDLMPFCDEVNFQDYQKSRTNNVLHLLWDQIPWKLRGIDPRSISDHSDLPNAINMNFWPVLCNFGVGWGGVGWTPIGPLLGSSKCCIFIVARFHWAPVSEPVFLDFQISRCSILGFLFFAKYFLKYVGEISRNK